MRFAATLLILGLVLLCQAQPSAANRWTVETGVQVGDTWDVTSPSHSTVRIVGEFGILLENSSKPQRRWSWGAVFYGALGGDDFVMAFEEGFELFGGDGVGKPGDFAFGWLSDVYDHHFP